MSQIKMLKIKDVEAMTGFKRTFIYDNIKKNSFPKPVKFSIRVSCWIESEVQDWLEERIRLSRSA